MGILSLFCRPKKRQIVLHSPDGETYPFFKDALAQPHVLIAGITGGGKSTILSGMISTLLYRLPGHGAGQCTMVLIDPKRVELADYARLPHTLCHAAGQNPDAWVSAFQTAAQEMDCRYAYMEANHQREFTGGDLYVFVDEWASIYGKGNPRKRECEALLLRLVSEGRAAHVHVVLATQVPTTTVLPSHIRENFVCRISLLCETASQSRVLIGQAGCEELPLPKRVGYCLGYYHLPGEGQQLSKFPRVTEEEIHRLLDWWYGQMVEYHLL